MQTILNATLDQFQNALGLNRRADWNKAQDGRRVYLIDSAISPTYEVINTVAKAFHDYKARQADLYQMHETVKGWFYRDHCKIRLAYHVDEQSKAGQCGGYIVLDDELIALHNNFRGKGEWMLDHAINDGATKLSCFDVPHLINLYTGRGFKEVSRQWNDVKGRPDVVWMAKT